MSAYDVWARERWNMKGWDIMPLDLAMSIVRNPWGQNGGEIERAGLSLCVYLDRYRDKFGPLPPSTLAPSYWLFSTSTTA